LHLVLVAAPTSPMIRQNIKPINFTLKELDTLK